MKAIVDFKGLIIDFSPRETELWLDTDEERPALTGQDALVAILALRQALGRCCRRNIERQGFALRYVGSNMLIDPVRIANFLAGNKLTQNGLYDYLTAA